MDISEHAHLENGKDWKLGWSAHLAENIDKILVTEMTKKWDSFCVTERNEHQQPKNWCRGTMVTNIKRWPFRSRGFPILWPKIPPQASTGYLPLDRESQHARNDMNFFDYLMITFTTLKSDFQECLWRSIYHLKGHQYSIYCTYCIGIELYIDSISIPVV